MEPFSLKAGRAIGLPVANIDTDQIIPARFMKRSRAEGYGDFAFYDLRFDAAGAPRSDSPFREQMAQASAILVAGANFGTGSSREAAVYALLDFGVRCVVAPSFGDIFASNAVNNGLLPAAVSPDDGAVVLGWLEHGVAELTIDLDGQRIACEAGQIAFAISPIWKLKLAHGWDDVDFTLNERDAIDAYASRIARERPWALLDH